MEQFKGYEEIKPYGDYEPLPKGAYVLKIMDAKEEENQIGKYIQVRCDIEEGDYKNFFKNDYASQTREDKKWHCIYMLNEPKNDESEKDEWTKRRFKTFTAALEDSNEGYHFDWDETKFKDKLIGGLFNEREYRRPDGSVGKMTSLKQVCDINKVRSGNIKLPKDDLLPGEEPTGFMNVPEGEEELPFA